MWHFIIIQDIENNIRTKCEILHDPVGNADIYLTMENVFENLMSISETKKKTPMQYHQPGIIWLQ